MFWKKSKNTEASSPSDKTLLSRQLLEKHKGNPKIEKMYVKAYQLWQKEKFQDAVNLYQKIIKSQPDHIKSFEDLSFMAQQAKNYKAAEEYLLKLLAAEPLYARAYGYLGKMYLNRRNPDKALSYLEKGQEIDAEDPEILGGLAYLHHAKGENDKANDYFQKAYESQKHLNYLTNWVNTSYQFEHANDPVYCALKKYEEDIKSIPDTEQPDLYSALAKAEDQLGNSNRSFKYYKKCADTVRRQIKFNLQAQQVFFDYQKKYFSKDFVKNTSMSGSNSDAPVFIIGMPRSGSTLIEQMLDSHPGIHAIGETEFLTHAIVQQLYMPDQDNGVVYPLKKQMMDTNHDLKWLAESYLAFLQSHDSGAKKYIDKELSHFRWVGVLALAFPNAKFIHCQRDKLDCCVSCYTHLFQDHAQEFSYDLEELGAYYRLYEDIMAHWHDVFPGRILDVKYEELVDDTEQQLKRILSFIDMPYHKDCLSFDQNKRAVLTSSAGQVSQPVYKSAIGKWKRFEAHLAPLIDALEDKPAH